MKKKLVSTLLTLTVTATMIGCMTSFYLNSAYPDIFAENGTEYTYETWSAQNSEEVQNAAVQKIRESSVNANMIRFETGTVLDAALTWNTWHHSSMAIKYLL